MKACSTDLIYVTQLSRFRWWAHTGVVSTHKHSVCIKCIKSVFEACSHIHMVWHRTYMSQTAVNSMAEDFHLGTVLYQSKNQTRDKKPMTLTCRVRLYMSLAKGYVETRATRQVRLNCIFIAPQILHEANM